MNSSIFLAVLCVGMIVTAAIVALIYLLLNPQKGAPKATQKLPANESPKRNWQIWILYAGIALILTIWTIWGALFFLAIIWVMRMNPGSDTAYTLTNNEKSTARRVYTWLFLSPLITVPIFIGTAGNASNNPTINKFVLAALIPLIIHAPLLLGLTSKSVFVYRHTQQGLLLIALRAGLASLAAINLENHWENTLLLFFFGNGFLWLVGSIVGWSQISSGKSWFMNYKSEQIILQKPPAAQVIQAVTEEDKKLEQLLNSMNATEKQTAKEKALEAFRSGIPGEVRKNAMNILSILGEVEKF